MITEQPLLEKFKLSDFNITNRIVLAPMTRSRAGSSRIPNELMGQYYLQRSTAGLLISEATSISRQGLGWVDSPGIYEEAHIAGWQKITSVISKTGTPFFLQLWHCGRASHTSFHPELGLPVAPSPIKINGDSIHTPEGKQEYETPRELTISEIKQIVVDYANAAKAAKSAGFDGIEIHSANGYLLDEFLQSKTNMRIDEYGGSIENRTKLLIEVLQATLKHFPANRIGIRLSPNGAFNDMGSPDFREQFLYVAKALDDYNLCYLHVMDGLAFGFHNQGEPLTLKDFREVYSGTLIGNCGYTKDLANQRIKEGDADLIAFGRPYISNPDLVERFANNWPLNQDAEVSVWYNSALGPEGYTSFSKFNV
jgi:N-ethylmaleimide reductase